MSIASYYNAWVERVNDGEKGAHEKLPEYLDKNGYGGGKEFLQEKAIADLAADMKSLISMHTDPAFTLGEIDYPVQECFSNAQ